MGFDAVVSKPFQPTCARARPVLRLLIAALLWIFAQLAWAAPLGQGFVDQGQIDRRHMHIEGWAASEQFQFQHFITQISVRLGQREVYRGRMQRAVRADAAHPLSHPDWAGN